MPVVIIYAIVAILPAVIGIALGCWLRNPASLLFRNNGPNTSSQATEAEEQRNQAKEGHAAEILDNADDILLELQEIASSFANDVGDHGTVVREINSELSNAKDDASGSVLQAISRLIAANEKVEQQLKSAEKQLEEQTQSLESHIEEARTDPLTQLNNRRVFDDEILNCVDDFVENNKQSTVMMLDVDFFKKFNDTYGHQAGDEVLRGVARVLKENTSEKDVVCRYGGEEFAIIFPGTGIAQAVEIAEAARAAIASTEFDFEDKQLNVSVSCGLAEVTDCARSVVKRSDEALYASKEAGRNCGHWNDEEENIPFTEILKGDFFGEEDEESGDQANSEKVAPTYDFSVLDKLPGIDSFEDIIRSRIDEWSRGNDPLSVVMCKLDKQDLLASESGDLVRLAMLSIASTLKGAMRTMDNVCSWDDTTFVILVPKCGGEDSKRIAARIRELCAECSVRDLQENSHKITASVGVTEAQVDQNNVADDYARLLGRVNRALKTAFNRGGNRAFAHCNGKTEMITYTSKPESV